ncbi:hypothetical protein SDJN03_26471, partial [Cucurbita argyrosperma subsp. sororia]
MTERWTMIKKLQEADMNGLLQLREDDVDTDINTNLFRWWSRSKVRDLKKQIGNEAKITLFDENTNEVMHTTIRWLGTPRYHIEWDVKNKPYASGQDMLMGWDLKYNRLAYKVLQIPFPEMSDAGSSTS